MTILGKRSTTKSDDAETVDIESRLAAFLPQPDLYYLAPTEDGADLAD